MKVTDIDVDKILFISPFEVSSTPEESEGGFFKKLFGKKETVDPAAFYASEVKSRGVDMLREELLSSETVAWRQESPYQEYPIVVTPNYLFIPGEDIVRFDDIIKFGLFNYQGDCCLHWQYAMDRINEPYDPSYTGEYEGEETYEVDRFKVTLVMVDNVGQKFEYHFLMEKEDRQEFVSLLASRTGAPDYSDDDVLKGEFAEDFETTSRYGSL